MERDADSGCVGLGDSVAEADGDSEVRFVSVSTGVGVPNDTVGECVSSLDRLDWMERFGLRGLKALPVRLNGAGRRLAA